MKNIQERIKDIAPYFNNMWTTKANPNNPAFFCVEVMFPMGWGISEQNDKLYNQVHCQMNENNGIVFFADLNSGIDMIFDSIEYNIRLNKEYKEKQEILNAIKARLDKEFGQRTLAEVKTLRIVFGKTETNETPEAKQEQTPEETPQTSNIPVINDPNTNSEPQNLSNKEKTSVNEGTIPIIEDNAQNGPKKAVKTNPKMNEKLKIAKQTLK